MTRAGELCRTVHHRRCEGRVQDKEGIDPNQQQFSFVEKQLEDDSPVMPHNRGESMLWLAPSYLEHEATIQEGVMNFHLCLSIPINSLWEALNVKARSPDKFMDVTSVKVSDEHEA